MQLPGLTTALLAVCAASASFAATPSVTISPDGSKVFANDAAAPPVPNHTKHAAGVALIAGA